MCASTPMITPRNGDVDTGTRTHVGIGKKQRGTTAVRTASAEKAASTKCPVAHALTAAHLSALNRKMLDSE